jgi:hypothetical protein
MVRDACLAHLTEMNMPENTWYRMPMIGRLIGNRTCDVEMRKDEHGVIARFIPEGDRPVQLEGSFADEKTAYGAVIAEAGRYFDGDYPRAALEDYPHCPLSWTLPG